MCWKIIMFLPLKLGNSAWLACLLTKYFFSRTPTALFILALFFKAVKHRRSLQDYNITPLILTRRRLNLLSNKQPGSKATTEKRQRALFTPVSIRNRSTEIHWVMLASNPYERFLCLLNLDYVAARNSHLLVCSRKHYRLLN